MFLEAFALEDLVTLFVGGQALLDIGNAITHELIIEHGELAGGGDDGHRGAMPALDPAVEPAQRGIFAVADGLGHEAEDLSGLGLSSAPAPFSGLARLVQPGGQAQPGSEVAAGGSPAHVEAHFGDQLQEGAVGEPGDEGGVDSAGEPP